MKLALRIMHLFTSSLMQINKEKYFMMGDGISVMVKKPNGQSEEKNYDYRF